MQTLKNSVLLFMFLAPVSAAPVQLWATFDQGKIGVFSNISIPLSAGRWRIGSVSGPVASNALIARVLGNLKDVRVGGLGNAVGTQSFGFILTNPNLGEAAVEDFDPFDDLPWGFTAFGNINEPSWDFANSIGGDPGGLLGISSFNTTPETLIGFIFSPLFHGDKSAAFGKSFTFRWSPGLGSLTEPKYVLEGGGRAILTGDVDATVPEPASLISVAAALGLLALRRRRN